MRNAAKEKNEDTTEPGIHEQITITDLTTDTAETTNGNTERDEERTERTKIRIALQSSPTRLTQQQQHETSDSENAEKTRTNITI